jgi:predicted Fe-Mo cluster-binding NifX family protein
LKVALPYWQDRISPVLDTADNFLLADVEGGISARRERINLSGKSYSEKAEFLKKRGVNLLLCGAVSEYCQNVFFSGGIEVIPWLRGKVDCVIEALINKNLSEATFRMPGHCGQRHRRRGGKGRRIL